MKILGIDYGRKKVGLAVAESTIASPYLVLRVKSVEESLGKVIKVAKVEEVEMAVIGVSEGRMAKESRKFGELLGSRLDILVIFQDETLTTKEAQRLSMEAGIRRKRRRKMEDAYSATLILQAYLNSNLE